MGKFLTLKEKNDLLIAEVNEYVKKINEILDKIVEEVSSDFGVNINAEVSTIRRDLALEVQRAMIDKPIVAGAIANNDTSLMEGYVDQKGQNLMQVKCNKFAGILDETTKKIRKLEDNPEMKNQVSLSGLRSL